MKRLLLLLVVGGGLSGASLASAADGDAFATSQGSSYGTVRIIRSQYLCDGKTSASTTCTTLDLRNSPGQSSALILERNAETGCTGNSTATFSTGPTSSGPKHNLDATNTLVDDDPTRLVVDLRTAPLDRYLFTDLSTMTDCTDFEVLIHWVEEKTSP